MSHASFRLENITSVDKQTSGLYLVTTSNGKKRLTGLPFVVTDIDRESGKIFPFVHVTDSDVSELITQVHELLSAER